MATALKKKPASKLKSGVKPPADMRPIHETNFQKEMLRGVFKYLVTHGYEQPVSITQLQTAGKPEIWPVITFLLQRLNSDKSVKSVTELVTVAKDLGYPYAVTMGGQANNHLTALGFLFWVYELIRVMDKDEETNEYDAVTQYLLSSYSQYMEKQESDGLERRRLFLAMQQRQLSPANKAQLREELSALEAVCPAGPTEQLEKYEFEIERLETENQSYLMETIAPLDERRNQIKCALSQPEVREEEVMKIEKSVQSLEVRCEALSAQHEEGLVDLEQIGLKDVSEEVLNSALQEAEAYYQEFEFEDLSLRVEIEVLQEKRCELLSTLSTLQTSRLEVTNGRLLALKESLSEAKNQSDMLEASKAAEKQQQSWEVAEAEHALQADLQWVHRELLSAC